MGPNRGLVGTRVRRMGCNRYSVHAEWTSIP